MESSSDGHHAPPFEHRSRCDDRHRFIAVAVDRAVADHRDGESVTDNPDRRGDADVARNSGEASLGPTTFRKCGGHAGVGRRSGDIRGRQLAVGNGGVRLKVNQQGAGHASEGRVDS